jgi:hypothetical protein
MIKRDRFVGLMLIFTMIKIPFCRTDAPFHHD